MNFILFISLFMVGLAGAQNNPRDELLSGVRTIDCEGVPGAVLYGGDAAFALVLGASDKSALPVAVAALYGKGRVVALGHPGFYSAKACEKGDTAQFMANALTWTGQGRSTIAVFQNHDFAQYLQSKGYAAVELKDWDRLTADVGVLVAYPDAIPEKELERVRTFMMQGGGLLASGIGWGWLQVSGGKSLVTDNRFNTLLKPAGLLITADVSGRTGTNGYTVGERLRLRSRAARWIAPYCVRSISRSVPQKRCWRIATPRCARRRLHRFWRSRRAFAFRKRNRSRNSISRSVLR